MKESKEGLMCSFGEGLPWEGCCGACPSLPTFGCLPSLAAIPFSLLSCQNTNPEINKKISMLISAGLMS